MYMYTIPFFDSYENRDRHFTPREALGIEVGDSPYVSKGLSFTTKNETFKIHGPRGCPLLTIPSSVSPILVNNKSHFNIKATKNNNEQLPDGLTLDENNVFHIQGVDDVQTIKLFVGCEIFVNEKYQVGTIHKLISPESKAGFTLNYLCVTFDAIHGKDCGIYGKHMHLDDSAHIEDPSLNQTIYYGFHKWGDKFRKTFFNMLDGFA